MTDPARYFKQRYPRSTPTISTTVPAQRPSRTEAESRRKAVLFCPDCDHESEVDGDWVVHEEADCQVYDCPDCGTTITKRPRTTPLLAA